MINPANPYGIRRTGSTTRLRNAVPLQDKSRVPQTQKPNLPPAPPAGHSVTTSTTVSPAPFPNAQQTRPGVDPGNYGGSGLVQRLGQARTAAEQAQMNPEWRYQQGGGFVREQNRDQASTFRTPDVAPLNRQLLQGSAQTSQTPLVSAPGIQQMKTAPLDATDPKYWNPDGTFNQNAWNLDNQSRYNRDIYFDLKQSQQPVPSDQYGTSKQGLSSSQYGTSTSALSSEPPPSEPSAPPQTEPPSSAGGQRPESVPEGSTYNEEKGTWSSEDGRNVYLEDGTPVEERVRQLTEEMMNSLFTDPARAKELANEIKGLKGEYGDYLSGKPPPHFTSEEQSQSYNDHMSHATSRGVSEEEANALWNGGYYVAGDGDIEQVESDIDQFGNRRHYEDLGFSSVGNVQREWGGAEGVRQKYAEAADKRAMETRDAESKKAEEQVRAGLEASTIPEMNPDEINALIETDRQGFALQQARALRAAMERGARAGISPEAMMGAQSEIGQTFGTEAARAEQQKRFEIQKQNLSVKMDNAQRRYQMEMAIWASAKDQASKDLAWQRAQQAADDNKRMQMELQHLQSQISPGDVLGGVLGLGTSALSAGLGSLMGGLGSSGLGELSDDDLMGELRKRGYGR